MVKDKMKNKIKFGRGDIVVYFRPAEYESGYINAKGKKYKCIVPYDISEEQKTITIETIDGIKHFAADIDYLVAIRTVLIEKRRK